MKTLGITGGIGSGKSYVAHLLWKHWGVPVYDCDAAAKRLENEDPVLRKAITTIVGPQAYDAQGLLCKKVLADFIFRDASHAKEMNAVVHPAVRRDLEQWLVQQTAPLVAVESAILFESGFSEGLDYILYVEAPSETRIARAMKRDGSTRRLVEMRMAQQSSAFRQQADFCITNDAEGDEALLARLHDVIEKIAAARNVQ